ncbi:nitrilase-related carbon-nitrogen hydrolase [Aeoliella straminimaris]|uniref:nitrilase-related carbon-nitrogen hydrolase n=1 Tax=Aeoliella straminimaris TaxID=2954799 RepID=UPI0020935B85|nr:nitrilase-related carbon-nitrogen hydrolase [Aeoliella straminimaris]
MREALGLDFSNPAGLDTALPFWGGSRINGPHGKTIAIGEQQEELIVADLDCSKVRQARFQLPTIRDSNFDLIHCDNERLNHRIGVPRGMRST